MCVVFEGLAAWGKASLPPHAGRVRVIDRVLLGRSGSDSIGRFQRREGAGTLTVISRSSYSAVLHPGGASPLALWRRCIALASVLSVSFLPFLGFAVR